MSGNFLLCLAFRLLIFYLWTVSIGPHSRRCRCNDRLPFLLLLESDSASGRGGVPFSQLFIWDVPLLLVLVLFDLASKFNVECDEFEGTFLSYILHSVVCMTLFVALSIGIGVLHKWILFIDPHHWDGGIWSTKHQRQYLFLHVDMFSQVQITFPNNPVLADILDKELGVAPFELPFLCIIK